MGGPIALCLERISGGGREEATFTQCVARAAELAGLGLSAAGEIVWEREAALAVEVAPDGRLSLRLVDPAVEVRLYRAGRVRRLEPGVALPLLQGDELELGRNATFRVHVHGAAPAVQPPTPLVVEAGPRPRASWPRAAAAAAVIGAAGLIGAPGCDDEPRPDVEVRESPPIIAMPPDGSVVTPPPPEPPKPPEPVITPPAPQLPVNPSPPAVPPMPQQPQPITPPAPQPVVVPPPQPPPETLPVVPSPPRVAPPQQTPKAPKADPGDDEQG